jgi:Septum formation/WD40-like Beta Propeller Repeat
MKLISVAAVFGLLVAACGGGDSGESSTDTEAPDPVATSSSTVEDDTATTEALPSTTAVQESAVVYHEFLEVGVCWNNVGNYVDPIPPVDCALDHESEIFARADHPAGPDAPFPGDTEISDFASGEVCEPAYEEFMGASSDQGLLEYSVLYPDESEWDSGDRVVICQVEDSVPFVGTAASAGLEIPNVVVVSVGQIDEVVDLFANISGKEAEPLTTDAIEENTYPPSVFGNKIFYGRWTSAEYVERNIVSLEVTTGEIVPVLATPFDEAMPRVSPDGTKIVFMSSQDADEFDIWVMDIDGSAPTRLTPNPDRDSSPAWSSDGSKIVYRARVDGISNIWMMNADGSNPVQITDDEAGDYDPVFSPDDTKIAFTSERSGNFDVWVMDADGANPVNLSDHPAVDEYPAWTPDGSAIVFTSNRINQTLWVMLADGTAQSLFSYSSLQGYGAILGTFD